MTKFLSTIVTKLQTKTLVSPNITDKQDTLNNAIQGNLILLYLFISKNIIRNRGWKSHFHSILIFSICVLFYSITWMQHQKEVSMKSSFSKHTSTRRCQGTRLRSILSINIVIHWQSYSITTAMWPLAEKYSESINMGRIHHNTPMALN